MAVPGTTSIECKRRALEIVKKKKQESGQGIEPS